MKIINLSEYSTIYTSNVYLVLGNWNTLKDVNTLIDVGRDPDVIKHIDIAPTGVGKKKIDQVIITHNHYDHTSNLSIIRENFNPLIYAFSATMQEVDQAVRDGQKLIVGDQECEIIHTPGHSNDSICIYCEHEGVLFAGDTPLIINSENNTYEREFLDALIKLSQKDIRIIYFGHGPPLSENCNMRINNSLKNIKTGVNVLSKQDFNR